MKTLQDALDGIDPYIEYHGGIHDDDCPGDDTCDCSGKVINGGLNGGYRLIWLVDKRIKKVLEMELERHDGSGEECFREAQVILRGERDARYDF